ncbi:MAG: glutaredoxin 3 [Bdellovibrionales bacterium]|nr:glutaredoxin 3 [Bdellovibrionales bacterium]
MKEIKLYSWSYCPYCVSAKKLLQQKGYNFEEVILDGKDAELEALRAKTQQRTVPQIFVGEEFIGGYSELAALETTGELDKKVKGA